MLPAPTSTPTPTSTASSPRTSRQNRKSGIALAIQSQNQQSSKSNSTAPGTTSRNFNTNSKTGRQQSSPSLSHARHQSMPAQQRKSTPGSPSSNSNNSNNNSNGNNGSKNGNNAGHITTLKRSSASAVASCPSSTVSGVSVGQGMDKQRTHQKNNRSQGQTQQSTGPSSKAKRTQRRKELEAVTDLLAKADLDATLNQSPTVNPSSPPSSTDSDDSESAALHVNPTTRSPKGQKNRQNRHTLKLSVSPPRRPSSEPVVSQPRKGMPAAQRQPSYVQGHGSQHVNSVRSQRPSFGSPSVLPVDVTEAQQRRSSAKTIPADKSVSVDRTANEKKINLYAGPTFHNSPAPTCLPIPAFGSPWRSSSVEPSMPAPAPFFAEAASPQLNNTRTDW
ncbi:hypothetical protein BGX28_007576 [Mortierella sp. GBA30]|nr:hypothetical protein BGX28_007576 [Mortierella sp. GBA30]